MALLVSSSSQPSYVPAVLVRLRELARLEANRIVAESRLNPNTPLPKLSEHLSASILRVTAAASVCQKRSQN